MPETTSTIEKVKKTPKVKVPVIPPPEGANIGTDGENTNAQAVPTMVKYIHEIVVGLVIVLFIGFTGMFVAVAAMFITSWNEDKTVQKDLRDKVIEQNTKIDQLYQQQLNQSKNRMKLQSIYILKT